MLLRGSLGNRPLGSGNDAVDLAGTTAEGTGKGGQPGGAGAFNVGSSNVLTIALREDSATIGGAGFIHRGLSHVCRTTARNRPTGTP